MRWFHSILAILVTSTGLSQALAADLPSGIYNIRQKSSDRYLDAYQAYENDFAAVTRESQNNKTQEWFLYKDTDDLYRIVQLTRGLVLDSHATDSESNRVVTRLIEDDNSQRWYIRGNAAQGYSIIQRSSGRYLDAHETEGVDFAAVTRPAQENSTQLWEIEPSVASKAFLKRFREGSLCDRFACGEFRNTDYSNKERAHSYGAAACNAGPHDIELVLRQKSISGWHDDDRKTIKPDECAYSVGYFVGNISRRQVEIRINNPRKSVYHMMRSFDENLDSLIHLHRVDDTRF